MNPRDREPAGFSSEPPAARPMTTRTFWEVPPGLTARTRIVAGRGRLPPTIGRSTARRSRSARRR